MTELQREAARRLIRQAKAANQAQVKGNCLMIMQILTGREVIRTHYPWQLMTKHPVFMAMEHRRRLEGFEDQRLNRTPVPISLVEADDESETSAEDSDRESTNLEPDVDDGARQERKHDPDADAKSADEKANPTTDEANVVLPEKEEPVHTVDPVILPEKYYEVPLAKRHLLRRLLTPQFVRGRGGFRSYRNAVESNVLVRIREVRTRRTW